MERIQKMVNPRSRYGEDVETGNSTEQIEMKWIQRWLSHRVDRYGEDIEPGYSTKQIDMEKIQRQAIPRNRYKWRGYRDGQFHGIDINGEDIETANSTDTVI